VSSVLSQAAGACALLYLALAFRRAYDATWLRTVVGTLAVFLTYIVAVTLTLLAIVLPGIRN
jgi:uncharacterized membrane protein (DUF485 family)